MTLVQRLYVNLIKFLEVGQTEDGYDELHRNENHSWLAYEKNLQRIKHVIGVLKKEPITPAEKRLSQLRKSWKETRKVRSYDSGISVASRSSAARSFSSFTNPDSTVCNVM